MRLIVNNFDLPIEDVKNKFIKNDSTMLHKIYGTEDVTPYWVADMDFQIAAPITAELKRLVDRGIYAYEFAPDGVYSAITNWFQKRHKLTLKKESFVSVPGVLTGIAVLIRELTEPGDGILIQPPVYHQFAQLIKTAGRKIVRNPLQIIDGKYEMDFHDLEQKLQSENVKVILLCNPHNPVGRVWKQSELKQLTALAEKYDTTIISDEIHSDIVYSGHRFSSIISVEAEKHIAVLGSPAKTFGMQSISNGYLYIPERNRFQRVHDTIESMYLGHGNAFSTYATIAAYSHGAPWLDSLLVYLEKTRSWIEDYLRKELPDVRMFPVEGTYQIWIDFSAHFKDTTEMNRFVAQQAKLGLTPGQWFDQDSGMFMRMNIASPFAQIQASLKQLVAAFKAQSSQ
jgi:cysteine-S-conjugate beta-lyase